MLGAGGSVQRWQAWMDGRNWRMSQRRRHLHRVYDAGLSRQVHAFYESAAGFSFVVDCGSNLWTRHSGLAPFHTVVAEQRAQLAQTSARQGARKPEKIGQVVLRVVMKFCRL